MLKLRPSTSFVSFRIIHSTSALSKQPPWDRLKYRRKFLPPYHSPPKIEDSYFSKEQYLSLEPPLAPGKWGSTPEQIKKDSFRKGEILQAIPSTFWKLQELYHLEQNLWFQKLDLPMHIPEALSFTQFITRTKLVDGLPKSNDIENKDEILNLVICSIKDMLKLETTTYNRRHISSLNADNSGIEARSRNRRRFISNLLETACSTIASALPDSTLSTRPIQTDEKCLVETFFKKAGYTKLGNEADDLYESIFPEINETVKDSDGFVRYRLRGELAWALRTCDPLLPFVTMTDSACFEGPVPVHDYAPEMYDLLPVDCFSFSSMPFCRNHFSSEFARSVAGYWGRCPFWEGDPCEFGLLGAVDTGRSEEFFRDLITGSSLMNDEEKDTLAMRHGLNEALLTAFAWTSAQAYNQGKSFIIYVLIYVV